MQLWRLMYRLQLLSALFRQYLDFGSALDLASFDFLAFFFAAI